MTKRPDINDYPSTSDWIDDLEDYADQLAMLRQIALEKAARQKVVVTEKQAQAAQATHEAMVASEWAGLD